MKKTFKQRAATLAIAALVLTGTGAGTVAMAAPAQAKTVTNNFIWVPFEQPGKQCQWHVRVTYNWFEKTVMFHKDTGYLEGYMPNSYCGH